MTLGTPTREDVAALPKVLLHDHLDGGLRPATVLELADAVGHGLPADTADGLAAWFVEAAASGSLERYLTTFAHTVAVMQRADQLRRIAAEAVEDLAADGVVHAELRYAPELHQRGGLTGDEVVAAVAEGIAEGVDLAAGAGRPIRVVQILAIMRDREHGRETAELALRWRDRGVAGVDLAGPEAGFGPGLHQKALRRLRRAHLPVTIHAGEGDGPGSIADALHVGGATRIGHGARLIEDIRLAPTSEDPLGLKGAELGALAHWVRDQQVPLELCPTSNLHTGLASSVAAHPISALLGLGFAVTVSTDNRLMSATSLTDELWRLVDQAGWTLDDLRDVTLTAAWSTFVHLDEREALVEDVLTPAFRPKGRHLA